jgi:hypothetical protein
MPHHYIRRHDSSQATYARDIPRNAGSRCGVARHLSEIGRRQSLSLNAIPKDRDQVLNLGDDCSIARVMDLCEIFTHDLKHSIDIEKAAEGAIATFSVNLLDEFGNCGRQEIDQRETFRSIQPHKCRSFIIKCQHQSAP